MSEKEEAREVLAERALEALPPDAGDEEIAREHRALDPFNWGHWN
jgi:hypothetical protein